jgi:hypothetical protein
MKPPAGVSVRLIELWHSIATNGAYHQTFHQKRSVDMSMESPAGGRLTAPLAHRVSADADAGRVADAVVAAWREIDSALTPIVGPRGFAALYKRSVYMAAQAHPWLMGVHDNALASVNLSDLNSVFKQQSPAEAVASAALLFNTFHDLLVSMVGPSLTERLLRSVWAAASSGPDAKDTTT